MTVYHSDDPDTDKAGQGLGAAPFLDSLFPIESLRHWEMSPAEQIALVYLLQRLRPKVAIEVGTRFGGSLQVLARYAERVYSLDVDPAVPARLAGRYPNVDYRIGPSKHTLPTLLQQLATDKAELAFVLVDGDHSAEGVRADLDAVLQFKPLVPLYVVMHDSFNPGCRSGLRAAAWLESPHVCFVELDFVIGTINPAPSFRGQLWGGLALALLLPEPARERVGVTSRAELTFQAAFAASQAASSFRRLRTRVTRWLGPR